MLIKYLIESMKLDRAAKSDIAVGNDTDADAADRWMGWPFKSSDERRFKA
jgi:hypothetical protein